MFDSPLYLIIEMAMVAILAKIAKEIANIASRLRPLATVSWNG